MKKKTVLKPFVIPTLYVMLLVTLMILSTKIIYLGKANQNNDDLEYVTESIFDNTIPVVTVEDIYVLHPYLGENVTELTGYYNYQDEKISQEKSIIQYDNTYLQNTGITYSSNEAFDIISILDGKVTKIYENDFLGKIVEITHKNNLISVYQMLSEVNVKVDQNVKQGDIVGKSGTSKLILEGNNMHFEIIKDGKTIDPNYCIGKNIKEI